MRSNQAGFTITEVLIATVIVASIVTVITAFALTTLRSYSINSARAEILNDANLAVEVINRDIRLSAKADKNNRWDDAYAPDAPSNRFSWGSTSNTLVLAAVATDQDSDIIFTDATNYISVKNNHIYYVANGELRRRVLAADVADNSASTTCPPEQANEECRADSVFAENVTDFSVSYYDIQGEETVPDNARSIEVTLRLTQERYGQDVTIEQNSRMVFRND